MNKNITPEFGVGQTDGVADYCSQVFPKLCENADIDAGQAEQLRKVFLGTVLACSSRLGTSLNEPKTDAVPEGRKLVELIGDLLVSEESALHGKQHLDEAFAFMKKGGNVLLVQNHRSGADSLVMEALVKRAYDADATKDWTYMSGHAVNLYLLPYLISSGMNRVQIFSKKYKSMAATGTGVVQDTGASEAEMSRQNVLALRALRDHASQGGKLVVLYPEGGRGDNGMKDGEPGAVAVPDVMAKSSPDGLAILPTYVDGATSILPVRRTDNEYNEFLEHTSRGTGTMTVGPMVPWGGIADVAEQRSNERRLLERHLPFEFGDDDRTAARQCKIGLIMSLIADLAPDEHEKGPYADRELRQAVSRALKQSESEQD